MLAQRLQQEEAALMLRLPRAHVLREGGHAPQRALLGAPVVLWPFVQEEGRRAREVHKALVAWQVLAGAEDDVRIDSFQYKFTYNYGTGQSISTPWTEASEVTNLDGDNSSLVLDLDFSAGNFLPGQHAVFVRAVDSAGNERSTSAVFVVDECRNRLDGTTSCNYVESLQPEPEPVIIEPSMTDPPYILVWVLSGIFVLSLIVMTMVISTSLSGPKKKKKGDEEEEDEDWMSEFIGTSQDLDMGAVTDTSAKTEEKSVEPEAEPEVEPEEDEDP